MLGRRLKVCDKNRALHAVMSPTRQQPDPTVVFYTSRPDVD